MHPFRTFTPGMESLFSRHRNHIVLLAVLTAQMLGLAIQVRKPVASSRPVAGVPGAPSIGITPDEAKPVRLIRVWSISLVTPFERWLHSSKTGVGGFWQGYIDLRHTQEQNQQLQKDIDRLRLEQAELLEDARQGQRLEAMMGFQKKYVYKTQIAEVIGTSGSEQSRIYLLDKGKDDGLMPEMAVITPGGIVGKIREVFPHTSEMLAVNDQTSGAGVILATTRIRGILRGNAVGQLQVVDLLSDKRIQPGEQVLTAGGDQVFPRGLPVGTVEKIVPDPVKDAFIDVILKPAADLNSLDEVMVITDSNAAMPATQEQDLVQSAARGEVEKVAEAAEIARRKAAAINAERLPSLKDPNAKPAVGPSTAPATGTGQTQPVPPPVEDTPIPKILPAEHPDRFSPQPAAPRVPRTAPPNSESVPKVKKPETSTQPKPTLPKEGPNQ